MKGQSHVADRLDPDGLRRRTKETYVSALYQRLAAHHGQKHAMMAVAHSIAISACHLLSRHASYYDLGAHYVEAQPRQHLVDRLTRRLERLGYRVSLELVPATA